MGKYVRDEPHPFLRTFGQPSRTCECDRDREQTCGRMQGRELIIGEITSTRLTNKGNRQGRMMAAKQTDAEMLNELFLHAVCRLPSRAMAKYLSAYVAESSDKRLAWEDILWMIINSREFIYQH